MCDYVLTPEEVRALTGYRQRGKQLAWLAARGIRAELGGDRQVKVKHAAVDGLMLPKQGREQPRATGPNLAALMKGR